MFKLALGERIEQLLDSTEEVAAFLKEFFGHANLLDYGGREKIVLVDRFHYLEPEWQLFFYYIVSSGILEENILFGNHHLVVLGSEPMSFTDVDVFHSIHPAVLDIFDNLFFVYPDIRSWKRWAYLNDISPIVISFLNLRPDLLFVPPEECEARLHLPTPGAWELVSKVIHLSYLHKIPLTDPMVWTKICDIVGYPTAVEFYAFLSKLGLPKVSKGIKEDCWEDKMSRYYYYYLISHLVSQMRRSEVDRSAFERIEAKLPDDLRELLREDARLAGVF